MARIETVHSRRRTPCLFARVLLSLTLVAGFFPDGHGCWKVDEAGAPLAGARITLMPGSEPEMPFPLLMGVADRNGAFTVSGVLPRGLLRHRESVSRILIWRGRQCLLDRLRRGDCCGQRTCRRVRYTIRASAGQDSRHGRQRHGPESRRDAVAVTGSSASDSNRPEPYQQRFIRRVAFQRCKALVRREPRIGGIAVVSCPG